MKKLILPILLLGVVVGGVWTYWAYRNNKLPIVDVIERTDVNPPAPKVEEEFTDDVPDPAKAPKFDPNRVDSRPLGDWQVNLSATLTRLDCPLMRPDTDGNLLTLRRNYKEAFEVGKGNYGLQVLPSVNMIDGKAKQFDDGLYAALDLAYYRGLAQKLPSHVGFIERLHKAIGPKGEASAYLAAALEIAGKKADCEDETTKQRYLALFEERGVGSKPQGFYTWSDDLKKTFRFFRMLQWEFMPGQFAAALSPIRSALEKDASLKADYLKSIAFYSKLSNRLAVLSVLDVPAEINEATLAAAFTARKVTRKSAALLPSSTSRETILFDKLFPGGLPEGADLMRELVKKIRSGEVELTPNAESGWYEYQAYALETMLLPKKGAESERLLLTATYKKRMLEAFKALITKRRETHIRQLTDTMKVMSPAPARELEELKPRPRLEPAPTFYLRTARAYSFLANFLDSAVGEAELKSLKGLRQGGERSMDLHSELQFMRRLFYGCYLLSSEDIGMDPALKADEGVDRNACRKEAEAWLTTIADDPDMAIDTRVIVPVYTDVRNNQTHVWATAGVRLAKLDASYLDSYLPSIRPKNGGDWKQIESWKVKPSHYLIPVDEFVSATRPGLGALNREEFRALCDQAGGDKEKIVDALRR
jgi:hypothetical protein